MATPKKYISDYFSSNATTNTPQTSSSSLQGKAPLKDTTNKTGGLGKRTRAKEADSGPSKKRKVEAPTSATKLKVKKQFEQLKEKVKDRERVKIEVLCHCTSKENKKKIEKDGELKGGPTAGPQDSPLAQNKDVRGTWCLATLSPWGQKLLTISLYGTERIKIPISTLMTSKTRERWQLFFESTYFYKSKVQYVRMVLANKDDRSYTSQQQKWCEENLHEVNSEDNPFLCWKRGDRSMKVISNKVEDNVHFYVEVLLLGDVAIPVWDTVNSDSQARANTQPTSGCSPDL